jgi:hypothetical protein
LLGCRSLVGAFRRDVDTGGARSDQTQSSQQANCTPTQNKRILPDRRWAHPECVDGDRNRLSEGRHFRGDTLGDEMKLAREHIQILSEAARAVDPDQTQLGA